MGKIIEGLASKKLAGAYGAYGVLLTILTTVNPLTAPVIIGVAAAAAFIAGSQIIGQAIVDREKIKHGMPLPTELVSDPKDGE